jgi:hypothetical protein
MACLMIGALVAVPIGARAQLPTRETTIGGIGTASCATAEEPDRAFEAQAWTMGYISAANSWNPKNSSVGSHTDPAGTMGEVQLECAANPSEPFFKAVESVYIKLMLDGR